METDNSKSNKRNKLLNGKYPQIIEHGKKYACYPERTSINGRFSSLKNYGRRKPVTVRKRRL
ncbi:MAG: hypothetical protein NT007_12270 [Candidatus Kapabacteria bacterium]|nr:hypothetical protein [Candidatus Kapabacteria bacterium]